MSSLLGAAVCRMLGTRAGADRLDSLALATPLATLGAGAPRRLLETSLRHWCGVET